MTRSNEGRELITAWQTSHRVTIYLIKHLPPEIWSKTVPGSPRRTIRSIAAHLHNSQCSWIKMIGESHGVRVPAGVDARSVSAAQLIRALERSSNGIVALIRLGIGRGGKVPPSAWQNFPTDLGHFLAYFVAHEAHHRGQLVMLAKQLGHQLHAEVSAGLWQWKQRARD